MFMLGLEERQSVITRLGQDSVGVRFLPSKLGLESSETTMILYMANPRLF